MILFLTPLLKNPKTDSVAGGIRSNIELIKQLSQNEKVIVVPLILSKTWDEATFNENVKVIRLFTRNSAYAWMYFGFLKLFHVAYLHKKYKFQKIISIRHHSILAMLISIFYSVPYVIVTRAYEDVKEKQTIKPKKNYRNFFRKILRKFIFKSYQHASMIIYNSFYLKDYYEKKFKLKKKGYVLYPTLNFEKKNFEISKFKNIGFIDKDATKGAFIIDHLAECYPHMQFHIFGNTSLDRSNRNNITAHGYILDKDIMFSTIDLLLVPSQWSEPFGRVALEALDSGTAVVVSRIGGLSEIITSDKYQVAEIDSENSWQEVVNSVLQMKVEEVANDMEKQRCKIMLEIEAVNKTTMEKLLYLRAKSLE